MKCKNKDEANESATLEDERRAPMRSSDHQPEDESRHKREQSVVFLEVKEIISNVTIEPMLFLKMVAEGNMKIIADTLEIDRICRVNLNFNASECLSMDDGNHEEIQNHVQRFQNVFNFNQNLMDSIIPLIIILLMGPASDRYGRKSSMAMVLTGFIGFSLVYLITALNSSWPVQVIYFATFLADLGGSWVVFNMAVYSYIADITTVQSRTKRMGIADAVWYLGSPIGIMLGSLIYKQFGYVAVCALSCILWVVCLLYTLFFIKEKKPETQEANATQGAFGYFISLFKSVFRKRPNKGRLHIATLISLKLGVFLVQGHQTYLWARKVLQWDATTFSIWSSLEEGLHQAGMVFWVWFAGYLALHDCTVASGGLMSIFLWSVTIACILGPQLWWLTILASILGLLEASIEPAIRSMLTAIAGIGEEGRVLSFLGILESIWLIVDRALYTKLYNSFLDILPQVNFIVQAGFALVLMLVVFLLKRSLRIGRSEAVVGTTYQQS